MNFTEIVNFINLSYFIWQIVRYNIVVRCIISLFYYKNWSRKKIIGPIFVVDKRNYLDEVKSDKTDPVLYKIIEKWYSEHCLGEIKIKWGRFKLIPKLRICFTSKLNFEEEQVMKDLGIKIIEEKVKHKTTQIKERVFKIEFKNEKFFIYKSHLVFFLYNYKNIYKNLSYLSENLAVLKEMRNIKEMLKLITNPYSGIECDFDDKPPKFVLFEWGPEEAGSEKFLRILGGVPLVLQAQNYNFLSSIITIPIILIDLFSSIITPFVRRTKNKIQRDINYKVSMLSFYKDLRPFLSLLGENWVPCDKIVKRPYFEKEGSFFLVKETECSNDFREVNNLDAICINKNAKSIEILKEALLLLIINEKKSGEMKFILKDGNCDSEFRYNKLYFNKSEIYVNKELGFVMTFGKGLKRIKMMEIMEESGMSPYLMAKGEENSGCLLSKFNKAIQDLVEDKELYFYLDKSRYNQQILNQGLKVDRIIENEGVEWVMIGEPFTISELSRLIPIFQGLILGYRMKYIDRYKDGRAHLKDFWWHDMDSTKTVISKRKIFISDYTVIDEDDEIEMGLLVSEIKIKSIQIVRPIFKYLKSAGHLDSIEKMECVKTLLKGMNCYNNKSKEIFGNSKWKGITSEISSYLSNFGLSLYNLTRRKNHDGSKIKTYLNHQELRNEMKTEDIKPDIFFCKTALKMIKKEMDANELCDSFLKNSNQSNSNNKTKMDFLKKAKREVKFGIGSCLTKEHSGYKDVLLKVKDSLVSEKCAGIDVISEKWDKARESEYTIGSEAGKNRITVKIDKYNLDKVGMYKVLTKTDSEYSIEDIENIYELFRVEFNKNPKIKYKIPVMDFKAIIDKKTFQLKTEKILNKLKYMDPVLNDGFELQKKGVKVNLEYNPKVEIALENIYKVIDEVVDSVPINEAIKISLNKNKNKRVAVISKLVESSLEAQSLEKKKKKNNGKKKKVGNKNVFNKYKDFKSKVNILNNFPEITETECKKISKGIKEGIKNGYKEASESFSLNIMFFKAKYEIEKIGEVKKQSGLANKNIVKMVYNTFIENETIYKKILDKTIKKSELFEISIGVTNFYTMRRTVF